MFSLRLDSNARFSNKQILAFLLPIFFEQLMLAGLGIADTFMVSFLGESSVAGVALVHRIDNFVKQFLLALAQGGSVVMSQYIGAQDKKKSALSLKNNIRIVILIAVVIMSLMVVFRPLVLKFLFGGAEEEVLDISNQCFSITAYSYPFVALYYASSASFRAMGESKIPSAASIVMMIISLALKYLFILKLGLGVRGTALSTLISMALVGGILLIMLHSPHNKISLSGLLKPDFKRENVFRILKVSFPNGIEQAMFQLGALAIAGLISGLGTAAIAADQIARSLTPLVHAIGSAFVAVMMMLIGQCMGAGQPDEAKKYTKHILKLDYICTLICAVLFIAFMKPLISLFNVSPDAQGFTYSILMIYTIGSILVYPTSFATAGALRGTGDTKFVMVVASASMFIFRIGAAYIFANAFKLGVLGAWIAMVSDWIIRSVIFAIRFKRGKWQKNKVI